MVQTGFVFPVLDNIFTHVWHFLIPLRPQSSKYPGRYSKTHCLRFCSDGVKGVIRCLCSAFFFTNQIDEFGDGNLSNGLLHATQSFQWSSKAAGQVVSSDGEEKVLPSVQVENQNVFNGIFSRVKQSHGVFADVNFQIDFQSLSWAGEKKIKCLRVYKLISIWFKDYREV